MAGCLVAVATEPNSVRENDGTVQVLVTDEPSFRLKGEHLAYRVRSSFFSRRDEATQMSELFSCTVCESCSSCCCASLGAVCAPPALSVDQVAVMAHFLSSASFREICGARLFALAFTSMMCFALSEMFVVDSHNLSKTCFQTHRTHVMPSRAQSLSTTVGNSWL